MNPFQEEHLKSTIFVVDDSPDDLLLVASLLKDTYKVRVANGGEKALRYLQGDSQPDLILLDVMMPGMDGHELLRRLKSYPSTRDIPVIFLTSMSDIEDESLGLELGAVDYITKPLSPPILLARIRTHLQLKEVRDFLKEEAIFLQMEVNRRNHELATIQEVTIQSLGSLAETRDNQSGNHICRVQHYVKLLAENLRTHPRFASFLTPETIELLFRSASLHDIGKVGIPDRILLKPGRLDPDEFEIMKRHSVLGKEAIETAEGKLKTPVLFLSLAKQIAYGHHEKWDGSGYPLGLGGTGIPISARLMAVADVYDAIISRRVYKNPMPHKMAVQIIKEGAGSHFDPDVTEAFTLLADEFLSIACRFGHSETDM